MALVRQAQQRADVVVLAHKAQLRPGAGAKIAHGLDQATGEVLNAQHVGVATGLEARRAAGLLVSGGVGQQLGQVGKRFHHGRATERAGQIVVLAVRGAAFGQVQLPVGRRRRGLQAQGSGGSAYHGRRVFGGAVGGAHVAAGVAQAGEAVALEHFYLEVLGRDAG